MRFAAVAIKLAALCCLSLAHLTRAEKLPHRHGGYNYQPPPSTASTPVYYTPLLTLKPSYVPPHSTYAQPKPTYSQPKPIYTEPKPTYSQPEPTYSQPKPTYSQPKPIYSQPKPTYTEPKSSYIAPEPTSYQAQPSYSKPATEMPMPFGYGFGVNDEYNGVEFGHETNSDGKVTTGEYRVLLPDGRTQIVTYRVDDNTGYQADVTYEGVATPYKQPQPSVYQQQQTYEAPTYNEAPKQSYEQPQPSSYVPPQLNYNLPQPTTHKKPRTTYDLPKPTYEKPQTSYDLPNLSHRSQKTLKHPDTLFRANF